MKKFYLLLRIGNIGYDEYDSMLVRAENSNEAREIANSRCGDEGKIWTDTKKVTCQVIRATGMSKLILSSFNAA